MGYCFTIRNKGSGTYRRSGTFTGVTKTWEKIPYGVGHDVESSVCQRLRSLGSLCSLLLVGRSMVECGGGCRWIYGALGSRGRQDGGQYRAGRRAPPSR